jgi:hypothetical protein
MNQTIIQPPYTNNNRPEYQPPNKALPSIPVNDSPAPQKGLPPSPPPQSAHSEYSYAAVEFRAMSVGNEGGLSTPVDDKTKPPSFTTGDTDNEYSYTPVTSRSLVVGANENAISIPVPDDKPLHVQTNNETTVDFFHTEVNGDIYALVEKPPKYTPPKTPSPNKQKHTTSTSVDLSSYDTVADPVILTVSNNDQYASIDWSQKRRVSAADVGATINSNDNERLLGNSVVYPVGFKPGSRRVSDGMLNTSYFPSAGGRKPPPMPRPYRSGIL